MNTVKLIADDLTGAMDTSHGFATRGYATAVMIDPKVWISEIDEDVAVLGVNTNSRYSEAVDAADAVFNAIEGAESQTVYKKVDSTLRGNFAAEIDAALRTAGAEFALVVAAFPATGRTTKGGIHYVHGTPVSDTEYGEDEKGPASSSIPELFDQVDRPVEVLAVPTIQDGVEAVAATIDHAVESAVQPPIIACDALENAHVATVAEAAATRDALYVGSAELARHISVDANHGKIETLEHPTTGAPLGVVGSVSATTLAQLEYVTDDVIVRLNGPMLVEEEYPTEAVKYACERLHEERPVILTAAITEMDVKRTLDAGSEHRLAPSTIRDRVRVGLATAATDVVHCASPSGLFLTGGDVAVTVAQNIDATVVTLTGEEVEAGTPVGIFADGDAVGMPLITKAGGFGSKETIERCLGFLSS